jgi:nucleoside-diphosphate-sugar epimerase
MQLLILGGTGWLGGHVAASAVAAGIAVTCLARHAPAPAGATLVVADRDDDDALAPLAARHWDAVVDVATQPGHVRRAARDLATAADHYVYVSSVSAYASHAAVGADETDPVVEPLAADVMASLEDYGAAKAACERAVLSAFGEDRSAIVRPGLIGGPGDRTGRTTYWPRRFAHPSGPGGTVLVPDAPDLPTSVIDVRDLATWLVRLATGAAGVFNAVGEPVPFADHIAAARMVGGGGEAVLAPSQWLLDQGVTPWAGPRSLPLWLPDPDWSGMNSRSHARARAAGLVLRPLTDTLADGAAAATATVLRAGLTDDEERELLAALDGR